MTLKQQIDADIKEAMKAKEQDRLQALRSIKSMILLVETDGSPEGVTPEKEVRLLTKALKQRRESADIYHQQGREDLAGVEEFQAAVIEKYMPKQLSEEELKGKLQDIIARVGASGPSSMGKVMGVATKELAGLADGKAISALVKQLLA